MKIQHAGSSLRVKEVGWGRVQVCVLVCWPWQPGEAGGVGVPWKAEMSSCGLRTGGTNQWLGSLWGWGLGFPSLLACRPCDSLPDRDPRSTAP